MSDCWLGGRTVVALVGLFGKMVGLFVNSSLSVCWFDDWTILVCLVCKLVGLLVNSSLCHNLILRRITREVAMKNDGKDGSYGLRSIHLQAEKQIKGF